MAGTLGGLSGAAALSLIGCGGGEEGGVAGDASGLLGRSEDTTKSAQAGGAWPSAYTEDIVTMDPIVNQASPTFPQLNPVYSQLLKAGVGVDKRPGAEAIVGDAAESYELSPDATILTLKLRPNLKFDPRPPTNGRVVDSADVRWSWDRFVSVGAAGGDLAKSRNPNAPIESIETPDARTVVFKMAFPYGNITDLIANQNGTVFVMPKDETFNFKADMRGSGPYMLESFRASLDTKYVKNPDWYDKPRPYFDRLERTLMPEYASGLAQFKAGNIWNFGVTKEDILTTKRDHPGMLMLASKEIAFSARFMVFSKRDDSIFKDVRLRRAMSMMLDRDLLVEAFENVEQFRTAGLPTEMYWHSHLAAGLPEWLDPKGNDLGEGAKYFKYTPAEARKLVEAAGVPMPVKEQFGYFTDMAPAEGKQWETMRQMINEGGTFNMEIWAQSYDTTWRQARQSFGTGYTGMSAHRASALSADLITTQKYTPSGANAVSTKPTPIVTDLVLKQKSEVDPKKRTAIFHEIQKALALEWPDLPIAGTSPGFTLHWPWLKNHNIFIEGNASAKSYVYAWYDKAEHDKAKKSS
jgi:peptide/nickel transport system substrate-binding protein